MISKERHERVVCNPTNEDFLMRGRVVDDRSSSRDHAAIGGQLRRDTKDEKEDHCREESRITVSLV